MTGIAELGAAWLIWQLLDRAFGGGGKKPTPPAMPPIRPEPEPQAKPVPQIPPTAPVSPADIPWPAHAGVPGAQATADKPAPAPPPGAPPPPPPPIVDEKMPSAQKAGPAVSTAAQKGIDAMKQQQGTPGTGKREYRPKRKHLTQQDIKRATELLSGWEAGKVWRSNDDPSTIFKAALHGKKKAIEVWTSNPDFW